MKRVSIIDCGGTNLSSVVFAFSRLGIRSTITSDIDLLYGSSHIILPGVGVCDVAMKRLTDAGLVEYILSCGKPILGICVGMQQLYSYSEEGDIACLGVFEGSTLRLSDRDKVVPHMGWNVLDIRGQTRLLQGVDGCHVYYVHSYFASPDDYTTTTSTYVDEEIVAVEEKDNFFGCQFHPERSGKWGSKILENFLSIE